MTEINTFPKLLKNHNVEIPIVQRDYVQGRKDNHAKLVRSNLLNDMKNAILGDTPPLDLNFVYGKIVDDKFIPLDGQQRLTTLFLLYVFAFRNDESYDELLKKFTYETRRSSRKFLELLINSKGKIFISGKKPSEEIEDSSQFESEWKNDPTVNSSLVVLDEINEKFNDIPNLSNILTLTKNNPLTFQFLEMNDLGMEDSLYIKLNARGKPLTSFENFKARLFAQLDKVSENSSFSFKQNFDGKWTDLFWEKSKDNFDDEFLRFFKVLFENNGLLEVPSTDSWSNDFDFEKLNKIDFDHINKILETLSEINDNDNDEYYNLAVKYFFDGISIDANYKKRLLFHAVTSYINASNGDNRYLKDWLRVARNLIVNSNNIDDSVRYQNALQSLNVLVDNYDNIINYISNNDKISGFDNG